MPEGDTVHKVASVLARDLEGRALSRVYLRGDNRANRLQGKDVQKVEALGKHLLVTVGEWTIRVHLGMRGSWHRYAPGESWKRSPRSAAVVLENRERALVCFQASQVELIAGQRRRWHPQLGRLGPDLLGEKPDWDAIMARLRRVDRRPIGEILLDQRVATGIGNVYKSELAFLGPLEGDAFRPARGVSPWKSGQLVADEVWLGLYRRARLQLQANLGGWRRTTTRDRRVSAPRGSRLWVYGRGGEPCFLCETPIESKHQGLNNRATFWCPSCQE